MNIKDLFEQADYLIMESSGLSIYPQRYTGEEITLEYDDGTEYLELSNDTLVEPTCAGTVLILGTEFRAYVAQQIKFEPTKD